MDEMVLFRVKDWSADLVYSGDWCVLHVCVMVLLSGLAPGLDLVRWDEDGRRPASCILGRIWLESRYLSSFVRWCRAPCNGCPHLDCLDCRERHQDQLDELHWVYLAVTGRYRDKELSLVSKCAVADAPYVCHNHTEIAARCDGRRQGHAWSLAHTYINGARLPMPVQFKILTSDGVLE